jgi:hypothetical protein
MNLRISHLLTLTLAAVSVPCLAQAGTGSVTFYSIGLSARDELRDAVVPVGAFSFTGWLFDGDHRMAHAQPGRFLTFHLPAGVHKFTVPYRSKAPRKTALQLTVEDGGHYYVRLDAKYINGVILPIMFLDSGIQEVSSDQALQQAGKYKRIDLKRIDPSVRAELDASPSLPIEN